MAERRRRESAGPAPGVPARGYSWPPFEKGNTLQLRHGAYSTLHLAPRAGELADELRAVVPAFSPADEPMVRLLAVTLARIERAAVAIDKVDDAAEGNELSTYLGSSADALRRLREDLRGWINTARRLANDLGMTPTSRARLGLDVARTEETLASYLERRGRETVDVEAREDEADAEADGEGSGS